MQNILIIGAGKIGRTIARLLTSISDYSITIADASIDDISSYLLPNNINKVSLDINDSAALSTIIRDNFAVLSAAPFYLTSKIAKQARNLGVHYLDLTEDVKTTKLVKELANRADSSFIPQCGLAPGFISIAAYDIIKQFDKIDSVRMRVGALPRYPANALNYNLTWSTDGIINEYCEPCESIIDGKLCLVPALDGLEEFAIDGDRYEAFNTSGGLGTLCSTLDGKVQTLNYKSIRYLGHRDLMRALLHDFRLRERRDLLKEILENAIPATSQDVVVIFITVIGVKKGQLAQHTYANKLFGKEIAGINYGAIQLTTASSICAVLDLLAEGKLKQSGFIKQEDISFTEFINSRFGSFYRNDKSL